MDWLSAFSALARLFDSLCGGSRSKLKLLALETMLSVSGCADINAPVAEYEWVRPIILAEDDRLTTATMRTLLAHNESITAFCDIS